MELYKSSLTKCSCLLTKCSWSHRPNHPVNGRYPPRLVLLSSLDTNDQDMVHFVAGLNSPVQLISQHSLTFNKKSRHRSSLYLPFHLMLSMQLYYCHRELNQDHGVKHTTSTHSIDTSFSSCLLKPSNFQIPFCLFLNDCQIHKRLQICLRLCLIHHQQSWIASNMNC